jgi:hypothetical protein
MKLISLTLAMTTLLFAANANAGPPVTVVFKNNGTSSANYVVTNSNEASTFANASPKPLPVVAPGASNTYVVVSPITPLVNFASLRYRSGIKECQFYTAYVSGAARPWNSTATGSGGAVCASRITAINVATNAWTVEFTMR